MQEQCRMRDQRPEAAGNARRRRRVRRPLARARGGGCPGRDWRPCWPPGWRPDARPGQRPRALPPLAGGPRPGPASRYRRARWSASRARTTSGPASVAAAFYVAWASADAVHDQPGTYLALCAPLVTAALERQLAASQPAPAAWQAMHRARLVSLVRVQAVTHPDGAPAPTPSAVYLRVYATRVTTTSAGRQVASDGVTVQLTRSGGRWLVSAVLFY